MSYQHSLSSASNRSTGGFTLLEMSIVLVILGLLVAGIFSGKTLMESSRIRRVIAEKESFDVAVMLFQSTYKALPGDATIRQFPAGVARAGTAGHGNNDQMIDNTTWNPNNGTYTQKFNQCGEALLFWSDLYNAHLINTAGNSAKDSSYASNNCVGSSTTYKNGLASLLPQSGWGKDVFWFIARNGGASYPKTHNYMLASVDSLETDGSLRNSNYSPIPPAAAYIIDTKIDDGIPNTGYAIAGGYIGNASSAAFYAVSTCSSGSAYLLGFGTAGAGCSFSIQTKW